jgi:hypothetical protein
MVLDLVAARAQAPVLDQVVAPAAAKVPVVEAEIQMATVAILYTVPSTMIIL